MDRPGGLSVDSSTNHLRAPSRTVTLGRIQPQAPTCRTVYCNDRDANYAVRFKGNSISTTKYTQSLGALPREISKHTGFAFDSPGYESFFASQLGIYAPQKAWDAARRASMRSRPKAPKKY